MFVMTQSKRIINLRKYRSITVTSDIHAGSREKYYLVAYVDQSRGMQMNDGDLDVLGIFEDEEAANIALENLAKSMSAIEVNPSVM